MFTSVISTIQGSITVSSALLCTAVSLALGFVIAFAYMSHGKYTKNFVVTLILLPALVQTVIMLVNGNVGAGIAVMGAFSLVRFRSLPGTARDISAIFFAMVVGLITGMGFLTYGLAITVIIASGMVILDKLSIGEMKVVPKELKVTIPEDLDYTEIFDDIFEDMTTSWELNRVKTINMGSMYELQYSIILKDATKEKKLIDEIRCRNGNLTIVCGRPVVRQEL